MERLYIGRIKNEYWISAQPLLNMLYPALMIQQRFYPIWRSRIALFEAVTGIKLKIGEIREVKCLKIEQTKKGRKIYLRKRPSGFYALHYPIKKFSTASPLSFCVGMFERLTGFKLEVSDGCVKVKVTIELHDKGLVTK